MVVDGGRIDTGVEVSSVLAIWMMRKLEKGSFEKHASGISAEDSDSLTGPFMGGLRTEISDEIRLFQLQTLKDVIRFVRMRDDQLVRQRRFTRPAPPCELP
ncbi:hypothetical protein CK203_033447 [Vitis vinifera]|uniref:Uncharacterized protein n=1 Tax=Vitis vinifera TaxID=29760 RepID=A0A438HMH6_VITVI|nr:hypothetical protein CK203_033447 [Vitis vinifera]